MSQLPPTPRKVGESQTNENNKFNKVDEKENRWWYRHLLEGIFFCHKLTFLIRKKVKKGNKKTSLKKQIKHLQSKYLTFLIYLIEVSFFYINNQNKFSKLSSSQPQNMFSV